MQRPAIIAIVSGALGGGVAIALMELFAARAAFPLFVVPFATSIVLVMGSPEAAPAQPRALIGGHLVATLVGLIVVKAAGLGPWTAPLAVGLAIAAMHLTRTFHFWWRRSPRAPACSRRSPSRGTGSCTRTRGRCVGGDSIPLGFCA